MTSPAASPEEPRPGTQTLRWEFPYREPVLQRGTFELRRVFRDLSAAARPVEPSHAPAAELVSERAVTFQVTLEPDGTADPHGVLRVQLIAARVEHDAQAPGRGDPTPLMTVVAADVWTQCYLGTDEGARRLLERVIGASLAFDGQIARQFLSARTLLFADELARLTLHVELPRDELAGYSEAQPQLTSAMLEVFDELRSLLLSPAAGFDAAACDDGIPLWDARLAAYIERLGQPRLAEELREKGRQMARASETFWSRWLPGRETSVDPSRPARAWGPLYRLTYVALTLWRTKVRPLLARARNKPAALLFNVADAVSRVSSQSLSIGLDERGRQAILRSNLTRPHLGRPIAVADLPAMDAGLLDIGSSLRLVGSKLFWPFLEWLVETAHHQALNESPRPDIITCEGGWKSITASVLEVAPDEVHGDERTNLRELAQLMAHLPIRWSDGAQSSALFLLNEEAAAAGRGRGRAVITFKLVDRLLEHEHFRARARHGAAAGPEQWAGWRLVPLVRPRVLLPLPHSPRDTYGAQALFLRRLWLYFVEHGHQLLRDEGILVDTQQAQAIAAYCQLPERLVAALLEHLIEQKVIEARGRELYVPANLAAREFIAEGWRKSKESSERGKASHRKRRK